jgi:hypothetical protein
VNPHPAAPYPVNLHRSSISQSQAKGKNIRNLAHKISENTHWFLPVAKPCAFDRIAAQKSTISFRLQTL